MSVPVSERTEGKRRPATGRQQKSLDTFSRQTVFRPHSNLSASLDRHFRFGFARSATSYGFSICASADDSGRTPKTAQDCTCGIRSVRIWRCGAHRRAPSKSWPANAI